MFHVDFKQRLKRTKMDKRGSTGQRGPKNDQDSHCPKKPWFQTTMVLEARGPSVPNSQGPMLPKPHAPKEP